MAKSQIHSVKTKGNEIPAGICGRRACPLSLYYHIFSDMKQEKCAQTGDFCMFCSVLSDRGGWMEIVAVRCGEKKRMIAKIILYFSAEK